MPSGPKHHVYLIPGFFGFVNFGRLMYFAHVREFLLERFAAMDIDVEIHRAHPLPVASLRRRGAELAEFVAETAGADASPIHLVGHSAGGLDARLFAAPAVDLGIDFDLDPLARRIRSVTTICAPHYGTPLASSFTGIVGRRILRLLSVFTVAALREGRLPLSILAKIGGVFVRTQLPGGRVELLFEQLEREVVSSLPDEDRANVSAFFEQVGVEQALIPQLMPESIDLFNATTRDRAGVRYMSVVAKARRPSVRRQVALGADPFDQTAYAIYRWLHIQTTSGGRLIQDGRELLAPFEATLGAIDDADNDGVVPLRSQPWGEVIHACIADHLDVVGHFDDEDHDPPHHDWLPTKSKFTRYEFEKLWRKVAEQIAATP